MADCSSETSQLWIVLVRLVVVLPLSTHPAWRQCGCPSHCPSRESWLALVAHNCQDLLHRCPNRESKLAPGALVATRASDCSARPTQRVVTAAPQTIVATALVPVSSTSGGAAQATAVPAQQRFRSCQLALQQPASCGFPSPEKCNALAAVSMKMSRRHPAARCMMSVHALLDEQRGDRSRMVARAGAMHDTSLGIR